MVTSSSPREQLRQALKDMPQGAKRRADSDPLQRWYPYYAGYSQAFATRVLSAARVSDGATVLDPWNGSGTTTCAAKRLGYRSVGIDLNPVAVLVAQAKLVNPQDALHVSGLTRQIAESARRNPLPCLRNDALVPWLSSDVVQEYRGAEKLILDELAKPVDGPALSPLRESLPPLASFLLLALMQTARKFAKVSVGTNPTWIRPGKRKTSSDGDRFLDVWQKHVNMMAADLRDYQDSTAAARILIGDARKIPLVDRKLSFWT